jgi:hypothetical protein
MTAALGPLPADDDELREAWDYIQAKRRAIDRDMLRAGLVIDEWQQAHQGPGMPQIVAVSGELFR